MRRLQDAVRGWKQRRRKEIDYSELPPPPLPLLPAQRPRPITPPTTTPAATAQPLDAALGTFALLPPELRRRVLVAAFGDCTLHLDLRPVPRGQQPRRPIEEWSRWEHGRGAAPLSRSHVVVAPGVAGEKSVLSEGYKTNTKTGPEWEWEWRWYGCVCHRGVPRGSPLEHHMRARGHDPYMWPHRDGCLEGQQALCWVWPRGLMVNGKPFKEATLCDCRIGALGWLRACRQAYIEGIEVLYATNTFFIESRDVLDAVLCPPDDGRHMFLPHRLAQIRSLELRCDFLLFGDFQPPSYEHPSDKDRVRLLPEFAGLAPAFPNLRSLVITFTDTLLNKWNANAAIRLPEIDRSLLRPLALAFAHLAPQQEKPFVVELPEEVFGDIRGLGLEEEQRGCEPRHSQFIWLRYPIAGSFYYYIKQGQDKPYHCYYGHAAIAY